MTADLFTAPRLASGFGDTTSGAYTRETWLTPPALLGPLGVFDLDPCACPPPRPWPTASVHYHLPEVDGLAAPWHGRVWLNPPYGRQTGRWLQRLADHDGGGIALVFARTDTRDFQAHVMARADGVLFLAGRVTFHHQDGKPARHNGGAPSCLVAYRRADTVALRKSGLAGALLMRGAGWIIQEGRTPPAIPARRSPAR